MVRFSLQRVYWRCAPARLIQPCIRTASQWPASAAQRKQRAEETKIETLTAKWQPHWDKLAPQWSSLRKSHKGNAYVLPMFPYPSGTLHLGHLRVYTISDVLARFKHMQGYNVLHPIGWDAFGLPAENAAIERGVHPEKWTLQNIESMKSQMKEMGGRWDWDSEIRTCDPDFYKHTQRIFLMLHQRGLAYQAESLVNYDPVDKTVLANEQVDANGCSWRSGAKVEKVMLKQWFLKIKEYQEPLLDDLDALSQGGRWPEKVLAMQKNWIGRSEGTRLCFDMESTTRAKQLNPVDVFTTRADTLFAVQYIALSLNHPIVQQEALENASLCAFIERAKELPPDTKEGFLLPNIIARNPISGQVDDVESVLPVYVAPYVLDDYGSGAVMGVPGHDTRDHAFWRANAGSDSIKTVVAAEPGTTPLPLVPGSEDMPMTKRGYIAANVHRFGGLASDDAIREVVATLREAGKRAELTKNWRLRDWLISRQRYWGTPIPIIHCPSCGPVPVPEQNLPVKLPNLPDSFFDGKKGNPLAEDENWKKAECPKCGSAAERETDTMDTFMDSSWYFFRFLDPKNQGALIDPHKANKGMPVDLYIGGVEHAILHLLYSRFISKFLASTSTWPDGRLVNGEPFTRLITQGMVHGQTYTNPENGRFLRPDELDLTALSTPRIKANGLVPTVSYEKMSKSKYNGVDPGATIAAYGADATRAHMLFQAPVGDVLEWDPKKITGVQRWLQRVVRLSSAFWIPDEELARFEVPEDLDMELIDILKLLAQKGVLMLPNSSSKEQTTEKLEQRLIALLKPQETKLWIKTQQIIASVHESYSQTFSLNTIVSDLMTLTNTIYDTPHCSVATPYLKWYSMAHLVRMAAPIAPGVAEEAWHMLTAHSHPGDKETCNTHASTPKPPTVFATGFPAADLDIIPQLSRNVTCLVQVDGKRKFEVKIEKNYDADILTNRESLSLWVLDQLQHTTQGKKWFDRGTGKVWELSDTKQPHPLYKSVPNDWQVIIANNGRLCNLVSPKKAMAKAKKGELDPAVKTSNTPAAVSYKVNKKWEVMGLNHNSNEKSATGRDKEFVKGLNAGKETSLKEKTGERLFEPRQNNIVDQAVSQTYRIDTESPQSRPSATSDLALRRVHARIDTLMNSLPSFLQPRYTPPSIFPVSRDAHLFALKSIGRTPSEFSAEEIKHYKCYLASLPTPPTITSGYILHDLAEDERRRKTVIEDHNAVFPEQLAPSSHPTKPLLYEQRYSISRKLREYRSWVNIMMHDEEQRRSSASLVGHATSREVETELMEQKRKEFEDAYKGALKRWEKKRWGTSILKKETKRVIDTWQKIITLWASGVEDGIRVTPRKHVATKESERDRLAGHDIEQGKELSVVKDEQVDDWVWLAGDDPNPKRWSVGGKKEPPKWE